MTRSSSSFGPGSLSLLASPEYVDDLYRQWRKDPSSLPEEWRHFFAGFDFATWSSMPSSEEAADQSKVTSLIFAYRNVGHLIADVNPLGDGQGHNPIFDLETHDLTETHLDRVYDTGHLGGPKRISLRELIAVLRDIYCRHIGIEYLHIQDREIRRWLQNEMEPVRNRPELAQDKKRRILKQLVDAEVFESFLNTRYQGQKRFSLEGVEALIPALHQFMEQRRGETGGEEVVMGMSHRGRLNVLVNLLGKPLEIVFHEFEDNLKTVGLRGRRRQVPPRLLSRLHDFRSGDSCTSASPPIRATSRPWIPWSRAAPGPSSADATTPSTAPRSFPLLLHGDAAFAGQGLVAETLNLSQLPGYLTGGTVHIIVDNQIGFTTTAVEARSSLYADRCRQAGGGADLPRQRRRSRGGGLGGRTGGQVPPTSSTVTSSSTSSAIAGTATTRATNRPSPSP